MGMELPLAPELPPAALRLLLAALELPVAALEPPLGASEPPLAASELPVGGPPEPAAALPVDEPVNVDACAEPAVVLPGVAPPGPDGPEPLLAGFESRVPLR